MAELGERPAWLTRAMNPSTPTTEARETIRTMSMDGKLFPTIRMINGKLTRLSDRQAYDMAIEKGDFIQFDSDEQATEFSKKLSDMVADARNRKRSIIGKASR
tara:strand:+ start:147 stop:455 length:309 start_codon:yes stop_codon:yes gene_type:complete